MPSLAEVREELAAKNKVLFEISQEAGPEIDMDKVTVIRGTSHEKVAEIQRMKREIDALGQQHDQLYNAELIMQQSKADYQRLHEPANGLPIGKESAASSGTKTFRPPNLREMLQESKAFKAFLGASGPRAVSFDLPGIESGKALITLTTVSPQNLRRPELSQMPLEERTVADLMLQGQTDRRTVEYYEETTWTNAAAGVLEGGTKPESNWGVTLRTETIEKIGHWFQATEESLQDVPWLASQLRGRLSFGVMRREENYLLVGTGTTPQIRGLLNRTGIQTTAKTAALPIPDAIFTGMQLVRGSGGAGFAEPTAIVMHPTNFTAYKLLRTADGIYLNGGPNEEGPDRMWGKEVRQTTEMTLNTALVGAFRPYAQVTRRTGITVTLSSEHGTNFTENKVTILAEERMGLEVYRPSAFCTVTALNL